MKSCFSLPCSKAAEKLAAMAAEEREGAEETSDKLKEMLVQVSPKNVHATLLYLEVESNAMYECNMS